MCNKIISLLIIISPGVLFPCAVCYGDPESPMTHGMNMGVLTLMGFIGFVLCIIGFSIVVISMKTKKVTN